MRPLPFSVTAASELLRDPETLATTLHVILLAAYGDDVYGDPEAGIPPMDPLELYARVREDFNAQITEAGENRLNAISMAISTDNFYEEAEVFAAVAAALYSGDLGDVVDGAFDDLSVPEILWAAFEVGLNRDDEIDFAPQVQKFMDDVIRNEAEENEELELPEVVPYYERFVNQQKEELRRQLKSLGFEDAAIALT